MYYHSFNPFLVKSFDAHLKSGQGDSMPNYFNDSPIETAEDDRYGITPFAESIAKSILTIQHPIGTTIALNGPWGSGKSSAINLIRTALQRANDERLIVTDFKCWWYRGEEALALAFLQNLHTVLKDGLGDRVKISYPEHDAAIATGGTCYRPSGFLGQRKPVGTSDTGNVKIRQHVLS